MYIIILLFLIICKSLISKKELFKKQISKSVVEILFETNDMYKLIGSFLELDCLKLRLVCKNWKNKKVICKMININYEIDNNIIIGLAKILNSSNKTNLLDLNKIVFKSVKSFTLHHDLTLNKCLLKKRLK
jgi:hypothetical protein